MSTLSMIGWSAVAVLVAGWLVVSFSAPGLRRSIIEWLSASAMYLALCTLFSSLIRRAWENGNHFALVAFGFLGLIFAMGLVVAIANTVRTARGHSDGGDAGATH